MKVLVLFAGTRSIEKEFEKMGHECYSIDYDKQHENIDWYVDIGSITAADILSRFGRPDIIWASFDCTTYSVSAISHHRPHGKERSEYACLCDNINQHVLDMIKELSPSFYFIENPRGMLRKMEWMQEYPRYTVTYCQYGDTRMKPTDIWTNHPSPNFKPMCKNGAPCHTAAPRGSRTGTQGLKNKKEKSRIPQQLCEHIVEICEEGMILWDK